MLSVVFPKAVYWGPYYLSFTSMMFLIFFTGSSVTVKLYADDAKLYYCIQCVDDMYSLQLGLDFVHNWSLAWQLSLSVTKWTVLQLGRSLGTGSYTINNINLPMCHKTRDLDILVDSEINFKEHIYNITASANQRAFLIKKVFPVEG